MRIGFLLLMLLASTTSTAHPHSWITLQTGIQGNDHEIKGLNMVWTFDVETTAYTLDGLDLSPAHKAESLKKQAIQLLNNMMPSHYFTYFYDADNNPIRFYTVRTADLKIRDRRLVMMFDLELVKPLPFSSGPLTLRIYEPSYFVNMFWDNAHDITLSPALQKHCSATLKDADPSESDIQYAASLGMSDNPEFDLGELFSQRLTLECQP